MTENNTLNEWSDGEDVWILGINENNTSDQDTRIRDTYSSLGEWSDPEADDIIRNMFVDDSQWSNPQADDTITDDSERRDSKSDDNGRSDPELATVIPDIQIERGKKRKRGEVLMSEKDYEIVNVKKFGKEPRGSGNTLNIREHLKKKRSVITISNNDNLCLGRALVVAVARIEKDPKYKAITSTKGHIQLQRALDLHRAANVPLGLCGLDEVKLFQKYLADYEITIVSGDHDNKIIYPPEPGDKQPIYLYYKNKHFDVITKIPGFLSVGYFCHKCRKTYSNATDHMCPTMCKLCRSFDCAFEEWVECNECERKFKSRACYGHHKEPIRAARSVCETIRKCEKCGKVMDVRKLNPKGHICGRKCKTCGIILKKEDDEHKCYIQKLEQPEEEQYNNTNAF